VIPIIHVTIAGTRIIGRMTAGYVKDYGGIKCLLMMGW
jgi:hypothetical protein